jgi:hypothetical protein
MTKNASARHRHAVAAGLDPAIHVLTRGEEIVDARHETMDDGIGRYAS